MGLLYAAGFIFLRTRSQLCKVPSIFNNLVKNRKFHSMSYEYEARCSSVCHVGAKRDSLLVKLIII